MKKLLLISILASILVVIFNRCFCDDSGRINSSPSVTIEEVQNETKATAGIPMRLRRNA